MSLLHAAALGGHINVARALVQAGANVNAATDGGETPVHVASANGHLVRAGGMLRVGWLFFVKSNNWSSNYHVAVAVAVAIVAVAAAAVAIGVVAVKVTVTLVDVAVVAAAIAAAATFAVVAIVVVVVVAAAAIVCTLPLLLYPDHALLLLSAHRQVPG